MHGMNAGFGSVGKAELTALLRLVGDKVDPALQSLILREGKNFLERVGSPSSRPGAAAGRWQDEVIGKEIPQGSSVLDLGCGNGDLLCWLGEKRGARAQGVEIDPEKVIACVERGVPVIQADLDFGLKVFPDKCFDYVILEETLQTLKRPDIILGEMLRVGRRGIATFPNFGFWRVRLDLAVRGRMPVTEWLPHRWYQTPNIHLFSIRDFLDYAAGIGMKLVGIHVLENGGVREFQDGDNLYAEEALVIFEG